jgi:hypothetical protein
MFGTDNSARTGAVLFALALFATLLNVGKPLTADDSVYYQFARHIADHPDDPYGFRVWNEQEANTVLAPPVLLYWWALVLRLGGDEPLVWKLSLFPFCLLLTTTLYALGRRFAPGRALLFAGCVSLSPVVLPCWNLMLDLPALALMLLAVLVFLNAIDRGSFGGVLLAGVIAALSAQTKYTGALAGGLFVAAGWWYRRPAWGVVGLGVLLALFVGWEGWIAWRYGASHFYLGALQFQVPLIKKLILVQPLYGYLGSTAVALLPLSLLALGYSARVVVGTLLALAAWFALVLFVPCGAIFPSPGVCSAVFGGLGVTLGVCSLLILVRLLRAMPRHPDEGFLLLWFLLEVAGYFALTPYIGTRRIIGVTLIGTLLACRLLARAPAPSPRLIGMAVAFNAILAVVLTGVDTAMYHGSRVVAERAARHCRKADPDATLWCVGKGAAEFYGVRAGMKWLDTDHAVPGDWVIVFKGYESDFTARGMEGRCTPGEVVRWRSPVAAMSAYQAGNLALSRNEPTEVFARLWRVR